MPEPISKAFNQALTRIFSLKQITVGFGQYHGQTSKLIEVLISDRKKGGNDF